MTTTDTFYAAVRQTLLEELTAPGRATGEADWNAQVLVDLQLEDATPLVLAAFRPVSRVAPWLECGADPNAADSNGKTALHWRIEHGDPEGVGLLIAAGADVERADGDAEERTCTRRAVAGWDGAAGCAVGYERGDGGRVAAVGVPGGCAVAADS